MQNDGCGIFTYFYKIKVKKIIEILFGNILEEEANKVCKRGGNKFQNMQKKKKIFRFQILLKK